MAAQGSSGSPGREAATIDHAQGIRTRRAFTPTTLAIASPRESRDEIQC